jgi:hypothetical protein
MRRRSLLTATIVLGLLACADAVTEPRPGALFAGQGRGAKQITVMSRNLYIGADVDPVLAALVGGGPADVLAALQAALGQLTRTDFSTRITALADEIVRHRPHVVGLQEVYELRVIPAALGLPGDPVALDFLGALQAALAMRDAAYVVAARNTLTDATLAGGAVRLVDHDVLLVDPARVTVTGPPVENVFLHNLPLPPGSPVTVLRGYVGVFAQVEGEAALVLNSHLESGGSPGLDLLRAAQAMELASVVGLAPRVILTGDLNDVPGSPMYGVIAGAGLRDVWAALRPGAAGFTCCHAPDLSNTLPTLDERIDYIWTKGFDGPAGRPQGQVTLTGVQPSALLTGAFGSVWPSDHAGVVAGILVPPSRN